MVTISAGYQIVQSFSKHWNLAPFFFRKEHVFYGNFFALLDFLISYNLTIYNPRDFKYRVRHPLVSTSWRLREYTDFDEWHLKSNLMTWCWNWYDFYVDSPLLSDVAMSWKTVNLAHFAELKIQRYCHFMPFDKKLACLANYQERRSFPWPLVT